MALLIPSDDLEGGCRLAVVGFFASGAVWVLAVARVPRLRSLMAHRAHASTLGSRDHGETPELYHDVLRRCLPRTGILVVLAFVIALLRVLLQNGCSPVHPARKSPRGGSAAGPRRHHVL